MLPAAAVRPTGHALNMGLFVVEWTSAVTQQLIIASAML
jgi:hypothetical protein